MVPRNTTALQNNPVPLQKKKLQQCTSLQVFWSSKRGVGAVFKGRTMNGLTTQFTL